MSAGQQPRVVDSGATEWPAGARLPKPGRARTRKPASAREIDSPEFTIADHLAVQSEIERRAYLLWQAGERQSGTSAGDWRQAELEVLLEFCRKRRER